MIATRDRALYSAIGKPGSFVAPNLKGLAERRVGSPEVGMLPLAVSWRIGAALLLAFESASAQSTGSIESAAPLGNKQPSRSSNYLLRGESDHENQAYPHARL
ncbi:hypothetical protein SBC1_41510 (plasmid) [Caballeronia sp. SBC1]|uniref:hypothetical protein n=1 Tax=unclassified Caballeronia TaxID=2646786 RepID=UPI0013E18ED8|nr:MULTISPECIES: hypothetical protein [unclassified Caballeronia]QIE26573.1 hypothetical protein SBC2_46430 [Caballeronia sp. SBC2]QIN64111.1 hypothetical protein SBC1_41510 [Caballeronia sp. SBC1]